MYIETDRKAFFIFGRKRKCRRKWNSIYGRKRNENENIHSFSAEKKRKRKSPDNTGGFFFFFIHSVTKSALQCAASTSSSFAFVAGGLCWRDSTFITYSIPVYHRYLCGIFLGDISTREQFAFLVYCYRVKAVFHNLCSTVFYWHLRGLKLPLLNTLSTEDSVHGVQKVLSNNGFRMANYFCCLSQNAMVCLAHCRQELQQKSWKTADRKSVV